MEKKPVTKKSWKEFRDTGLLVILNQLLHLFGWAIAYELGEEGEIINVYPARVVFRGFSEEVTAKSYKKVSEYMHKNSKELLEEAEKE